MAGGDYICVYRQFFEELAKCSEKEDQRPMRLNIYSLRLDELVGEVMQSCVNFFTERQCPNCLIVPLTRIVVDELLSEAKKQPEEVDTPLKLNKKTHAKIYEVCLRYTDNEKLSSLPPPVSETPFSTHATKHTRRRMEDRHICLPRFNSLHGVQCNSEAEYYGIFDGHAGTTAASFAVSHLHQFLAESPLYPDDPVLAFRQAYEKTESRFNTKKDESGTAALAILHQPLEKKLIVSWVGDSQALLVTETDYMMLVDPHKPDRDDERKRIESLEGFVLVTQDTARVNGELAISRAIGDRKLKPYVSAEPEFQVLNLTGTEHFVVMGSDGLWDVVDPEQVIETVYFELKNNEGHVETVAKRLVDLAKENNSEDNISVIVFFLTDPSEIKNRSVEATGHRPKIIDQNGSIMDANYQANESALNGIYETSNGNYHGLNHNSHDGLYEDQMRNDSDEDLGPETDVDAIDDVLMSPVKAAAAAAAAAAVATANNNNPFAADNDCWQQFTDSPRKLHQFTPEEREEEVLETETDAMNMKFTNINSEGVEGFGGLDLGGCKSSEEREEGSGRRWGEETDAKLSPLGGNSFEGSVIDNYSDPFNVKNNGNSEDNKCASEMDESKEKNPTNFDPYQMGKEEEEPTGDRDFVPQPNNENAEVKTTEAEWTESQDRPETDYHHDFFAGEKSPNEETCRETLSPTILSELETCRKQEQEVDFSNTELDAAMVGNTPELCSVVDVLEAEKRGTSDFSRDAEEDGGVEESPQIEPTAPVLDGDVKDEIIGESSGEVEDSEDEEWNYIKVGSQGVAVSDESQPANSVLAEEQVQETKAVTMNSPLNPDAAEFVPVSPISTGESDVFERMETPVKGVPGNLAELDIVASSPNWMNMGHVNVPEESAFLDEIKSRPSNITEGVDFSQKMDAFDPLKMDEGKREVAEEEFGDLAATKAPEVMARGIELATDMTGSFIDTSTMSFEGGEVPQRNESFIPEIKEPVVEERLMHLTSEKVQSQEAVILEQPQITSEMADLVSVGDVDAVPSPVSLTPATPKSTAVEVASSPESEASTLPIADVQPSPLLDLETKPVPVDSSSEIADLTYSVADSSKPTESSVLDEEKGKGAVEAAAAVGAAAAAAAGLAVAVSGKKDEKKSPTKPTPGKTSKPAAGKPAVSDAKATATAKKAPTTTRTTTTVKTTTGGSLGTSPMKTATSRVSSTAPKPAPKSPASATSSVSKTAATRPKTTTTTVSRTPITRTTVTTTTVKSTATAPKPAARTSATTLAAKPKPRVSSAPLDKKTTTTTTTTTMNGDVKTTVKRTEITRKPLGTSTLTTRTSLTSRPATAPAKPAAAATGKTLATTRTVTAKPRTTISNATATSTTTTSTVTTTGRLSAVTKKTTTGSEKQAKEMANRLTSKTSTAVKMNGLSPTPKTTATTLMRTKKTTTTTKTGTSPSKAKPVSKTENKAEKIVDKTFEIIQSQNETPLIENTNEINLINSIASD